MGRPQHGRGARPLEKQQARAAVIWLAQSAGPAINVTVTW